MWKHCRDALATTAEELLGPPKRIERSRWFDEECKIATDAKNAAYKDKLNKRSVRTRRSSEEYRVRRRGEKKIHRKKKRIWENKQLAKSDCTKKRGWDFIIRKRGYNAKMVTAF